MTFLWVWLFSVPVAFSTDRGSWYLQHAGFPLQLRLLPRCHTSLTQGLFVEPSLFTLLGLISFFSGTLAQVCLQNEHYLDGAGFCLPAQHIACLVLTYCDCSSLGVPGWVNLWWPCWIRAPLLWHSLFKHFPLGGTPLLIEDLPEVALFYQRASSGWGLAKCMAFLFFFFLMMVEGVRSLYRWL